MLTMGSFSMTSAQQLPIFHFDNDSTVSYTQDFIEINNLILLPVSFNGIDSLYFILDSGAENISLFGSEFENTPVDTTRIRQIKVAGLGIDDDIKAFVSPSNRLKMGSITAPLINVVYIPDDFVQFSDLLGHPVHGIIGIPIFHAFIVKLDYYSKQVTFTRHGDYKIKRRFQEFPLRIDDGRPFIDLEVEVHPQIFMSTTLLLDLGESKPMSLFLSTNEAFILPYPNYYANLGKGLNGLVTGRVARINKISLGKHDLRNVVTAFPDEHAVRFLSRSINRNGSLGAGILKRFISIFDLKNERLYLKRTGILRQPFSYDKTGLIIVAEGPQYNTYRISGVIRDSPADKSGLKKNDIILGVNGQSVEGLKLGELLQLIENGGRKVTFGVKRGKEEMIFSFKIFRLS